MAIIWRYMPHRLKYLSFRKSNKMEVFLLMKRIIFKSVIIVLFSIVLLAGLFYYRNFREQQRLNEIIRREQEFLYSYAYAMEWVERLILLYSDETYAQLGTLFETVEDDLEQFVNHLYENDLFEELTRTTIEFPLTEYEVMYNIETFENNYELLVMIKDMNECGIISRIDIPDTEGKGVQINFRINPEHTTFTERLIPHVQNSFFYAKGEEVEREVTERSSVRNVGGNWYMEIERTEEFSVYQPPPPLED